MDSTKAQNIFGSTEPSKRGSSTGGNTKEALNYKALNETLLRKIQQIKKQLCEAEKGMDKLRDENMELRQTNQKLISCTEEEKIELIVNQRLKKKLSHFTAIGQRTIQFLQNAGADMTEAIKDIQVQDAPSAAKRVKKQLIIEPNLPKVEESPLSLKASTSSLPEVINIVDSGDEEEEITPKKENVSTAQRVRGRRSALLDINLYEEETPKVHQNTGKRQPLFIKPETPKNKKTSRKDFRTPTIEAKTETSCSTARPARSARPKNLKEPSLGSKMRNPGKFDEPCPFISTTY